MIDLHTHTFASDGVLCPAELVRRAETAGLAAIAITDHADASNLERLVRETAAFVRETQPFLRIRLVAGIELTHVPPGQVRDLVRRARRLGAALVVMHGETVSEPVAPGTNRAAIEAGVDILAHPGLITEAAALLDRKSVV
jgi:putative hydrolase